MRKYIGRTVQIIYLDRNNKITQRTIRIRSINNNRIKAYDLDQRAPRVFNAGNILAVQLVDRSA